jgi:hypothetical protein
MRAAIKNHDFGRENNHMVHISQISGLLERKIARGCQLEAIFQGMAGTPIDTVFYARIPNQPGNVMENGIHVSGLKVGSIAFLAGVLATLVTAYAVVSRKRSTVLGTRPEFGGYDEEEIGI